MIVFDLLCAEEHRFEGWFASARDFDSQQTRGLLTCPVCSSGNIERVPSATRFNIGVMQARKDPEMEGRDPFAIAQMLYSRFLDELLSKTEDVGAAFPAEARRIYYQEAPARAIRGQATQAEHDTLVDEGIPIARLPVPPAGRLN